MELDSEKKFSCQSGGHTRYNLIADSENKIDSQSGYGLRVNPRKTRRAEDLKSSPVQRKLMICKQCGKGFQSLKALCGHMACHSEKERVLKDDRSWSTENQKVERGSGSDSEREGQKGPKRAAAMRTRGNGSVKPWVVLNGDSSSVSEIDCEQEEGAMCLIMLSKDSSSWAGVSPHQEPSDSMILEANSSSVDMKTERKRDWSRAKTGDESVDVSKFGKGKWKSGDFDHKNAKFGEEKEKSDESVEGCSTVHESKSMKLEMGKKLIRRGEETGIGSRTKKFHHKKETKKKKKKIEDFGERKLKTEKTKAHQCPFCSRVFKSGQALGGHKRSHLLGNSESRNNQITAITGAEKSEVGASLDLNQPPPEDDYEHSQFIQC